MASKKRQTKSEPKSEEEITKDLYQIAKSASERVSNLFKGRKASNYPDFTEREDLAELIGKEFGEDFRRQPGKIPTILVNAAARFDETVLDYQIEQAKERLEIEEKRAETFDSIEEKRERLEELLRKEQEHSSE